MEILVPRDAEREVVAELTRQLGAREEFEAVDVGTEIPRPRPVEFVRVLATGGGERDLVTDTPTLVIEAFAEDANRAFAICAFAVGSLQAAARDGFIGAATCYRVRVAGLPANLPMPSVPDRERFTATISADLRRVAI